MAGNTDSLNELAGRLTGAAIAAVLDRRFRAFERGLVGARAAVSKGRVAVYESGLRRKGVLAQVLPQLPDGPEAGHRYTRLGPPGAQGTVVLSGSHKPQWVESLDRQLGPGGGGVSRAREYWVYSPLGGLGVDLFRAAVLGPEAVRHPHGVSRGASRSDRQRFMRSFSALLLGKPGPPPRGVPGDFVLRYLCAFARVRDEGRLEEAMRWLR